MGELDSRLSFLPRRSRLKSTTFRTLLRILSHCVDDSVGSPSPILSDSRKPGNFPNPSPVSVDSSANQSSQLRNDETVDHGILELDNSFLAKEPNADGNPKPIDAESGIYRNGDVLVDGALLGQTAHKPVDEDKVEFKNLLMEKDLIVDGKCRLVDTQNVVSCDRELGHVARLEENDEFVIGDNLKLKKLSTEEVTMAEEFVHHDNHKLSILLVQDDPIVEEAPKSSGQDGRLGPEHIGMEALAKEVQQEANREFGSVDSALLDAQNGIFPEQIIGEELGHHHMQQEGQNLEALVSSDSIADSVSPISHRDIEEGEIPDDLGVPKQLLDSVPEEHVGVFEDRKVEEGLASDGLAHTCKEQLGVDRKDMASGSHRSSGFDSSGNCLGAKTNARKGIRGEDKANVPGNSKTIKVKCSFGVDHMQTLGEMKVIGNKPEEDARGQVVTLDSLGSAREVTEKISSQCQGMESSVKDTKVREKKKRAPLNEARKAKKKESKKRKRAKMNREQGVKRLKLQPFTKPKVVIDCVHYLRGRCQQGEKCKFSHDAIPLTKSQPCRHFASQSCLKGEDCPFDHQLSKYPCINFNLKGMCRRGDTCLFSHKIPLSEGFSWASKVRSPESLLPLEKTNIRKPMNANDNSPLSVNRLFKDPTPTTPFSLESYLHSHPKEPVAQTQPKPPAKAPKGVQFLSFGKAPLDDTNKELRLEQNNIEIPKTQKQTASDKLQNSNEMPCKLPGSALSSGAENKNPPISSPKECFPTPASAGKYGSDTGTCRFFQSPLDVSAKKAPGTGSFSSGLATTKPPCGGGSQTRSMDASKILEEFLLGGCMQ
ncbi:zinc finger CCCH domain-containing protein 7 [Magnolia sinica]|uniref:zinc finger CCCH domain-containing protein 7 n=1 Tax=Magnolia sinica TaxID=86752 RepID=UPI00265B6513|nr:zinc finger CCCH domain-containing protein 7 [Magnolia sinica]